MAPGGRSSRVKALAVVFVVLAAALALWWTGAWEELWELFSDRERMRRAVQGAGPLAPAAYVLFLAVQAVVAPLPAPALAFAVATSSAPPAGSS